MENHSSSTGSALRSAISDHPRLFEENKYVYPVVSRRSKGISVGINLNPDKICNFDCIYCQVDRTTPPVLRNVEPEIIERELRSLLGQIRSGALFEHPRFQEIPDVLKRTNDIAFSGDGEPTTYPAFREVVERVAAVKREFGLDDVKLNVITNATRFHREGVMDALEILQQNNGEIWAKLDAGSEGYYNQVERTRVPFDLVVSNIKRAAAVWPLVIQTLFMRIHGQAPPESEILAYCEVLNSVLSAGGTLKLIQIYTVARDPAESYVSSLPNEEVDTIADLARRQLPDIPLEVYYGS